MPGKAWKGNDATVNPVLCLRSGLAGDLGSNLLQPFANIEVSQSFTGWNANSHTPVWAAMATSTNQTLYQLAWQPPCRSVSARLPLMDATLMPSTQADVVLHGQGFSMSARLSLQAFIPYIL